MSTERTRIESVVLQIWQSVLEVASVHSGDNFLEMGGNSLCRDVAVDRIRAFSKLPG